MQHEPVMLAEVINGLAIDPNGIYIDGTFGRGGHSQAILDRLNDAGRLMVIDQDPEAIAYAKHVFANDDRVVITHGSFAGIKEFTQQQGWLGSVNGVLLDLGVSSPQLDDPHRGFSFLNAGPLDMRMDNTKGITAAEWLQKAKEEEIARVLFEYGEERFSRRIARAIVTARRKTPFTTTTQLAEIIASAHPRWERGKHPATRSFQAIRIWINQELAVLPQALEGSEAALKSGGRLVVISFHSLEDRIVKRFIQGKQGNEHFDAYSLGKRFASVDKAKASMMEIRQNPRSRSAVLRIAEKK